jgi:outer membrane protein with beta-barrel domain
MKRIALFVVLGLFVAAPGLVPAQTENHVEFGPFADYFRLDRTNVTNFVGVGGRIGFYLNPYASVEGEMAYDFARNNTFTTSNGVTTSFTTTSLRPLTGLFGPKLRFGKGKFDVFATGKVGFQNFSTTSSFPSSVGSVTTGDTRFALYPGVGIEGFWGGFGLRADVGDQIYFLNGAQHNLRVTFGPQFRF